MTPFDDTITRSAGHSAAHSAALAIPCLARAAALALPVLLSSLAPGLAAADTGSAGDAAAAEDARPRVMLETNRGDIDLALFPDRAPKTVANFLRYVDDGFYDGTVFHRVIEGFMIQGGGFDASLARLDTRAPIDNEADNGLGNRRYSIAMARTNAPHSATAQFFINVADNRNLDHTAPTPRGWGYAVFGEVVGGRDVVDAISEVATGATGPFGGDVPREPVTILHAARVPTAGSPADGPVVPGTLPASPADGAAADAVSAAERALPGLPAPAASGNTN